MGQKEKSKGKFKILRNEWQLKHYLESQIIEHKRCFKKNAALITNIIKEK